jgi:hypothetical protein
MNLIACPLCLYQRTFILGAVGVLCASWLVPSARKTAGESAWLALPIATSGLIVACFHVMLEANGKLVCPNGFLQLGTAPVQALTLFVLFVVLLLGAGLSANGLAIGLVRGLPPAVLIGAAIAYGTIISGPKLPKAELTMSQLRDLQAQGKLEICKPVLAESANP